MPSVVPLSTNVTLPVGLVPVTVAVNLTCWPKVEGLTEDASVVVVVARAASVTRQSSKPRTSSKAAI